MYFFHIRFVTVLLSRYDSKNIDLDRVSINAYVNIYQIHLYILLKASFLFMGFMSGLTGKKRIT